MKRFTEFLLEDDGQPLGAVSPGGKTKPTPGANQGTRPSRVVQKPPVEEKDETTTFADIHKDVYGNQSQALIDDAVRAREQAAGTEHEVGGFANLGNYSQFQNSPINVHTGAKIPADRMAGIEGEAQERTSTNPNAPGSMTLFDIPTVRRDDKGNLIKQRMDPGALRAHEGTHTIQMQPDPQQKGSVASTIGRPLSKQEEYLYSPSELAAYQSGYEAAYFKDTRRTLPSTMTDKDYNDFIAWGQKTGKIHPEHIKLMQDPNYRQKMMDLARQTAQVQQQQRASAGEGQAMA